MKKITITLLAVLFITTAANAQSAYKHSAGINVGSLEGVSYKTMLSDHFAISTDLGVKFTVSPTKGSINISPQTFELNPNFMYQSALKSNISFFAGGGVSLGYCWTMLSGNLGKLAAAFSDVRFNAGKFGINAIAGLEYKFNGPWAISFDFRPGYGMIFYKDAYYNYDDILVVSTKADLVHYFDWGLNLGIRYIF